MNTLHAALPPLAQSASEIKEIVSSTSFYQKLGGAQPIEQIQKVDGGYRVFTRSHSIYVKVNYLQSHRPGPANFSLEFSEVLAN